MAESDHKIDRRAGLKFRVFVKSTSIRAHRGLLPLLPLSSISLSYSKRRFNLVKKGAQLSPPSPRLRACESNFPFP